MKDKLWTIEDFKKEIKDDMTIMVGGFAGCGTPEILVDAIVETGVKNLTIISNDSTYPGRGVSKLIASNQVRKLVASHIGLNPETAQKMFSGEVEVQLVPMGSLVEMIRAGGAGLGGVLTPTGIGTEVENGKQKIMINDMEYLLELPLKAELAILRGSVVDKVGNVVYHGTTRTFNQVMATAAEKVVVAAEKIVETGEIDPNDVMTSGIFIDYVIGGEPGGH